MNEEVKTIHLPHLGKNITVTVGEDSCQETIAFTLAVEGHGGDPNDPGGATNYGWTLATLKALGPGLADFDHDHDVDLGDLRDMTEAEAGQLYQEVFWDKLSCARFTPRVACVLFDSAVNLGKPRAIKFLQQAFNCLPLAARENAMCLGLSVDGAMGPATLGAVAKIGAAGPMLALALLGQRRAYYGQLLGVSQVKTVQVGGKAKQFTVYPYRAYYGGWLNRCDDLQYYMQQVWP
jgi:lysozyme family protein